MMAYGLVQHGWGKAPNCGRHTADPDDPRRGVGSEGNISQYTSQLGEGTGAAQTCGGVAWPKAAVVVQRQRPGGRGTG
jgi:hypothetical protein